MHWSYMLFRHYLNLCLGIVFSPGKLTLLFLSKAHTFSNVDSEMESRAH
jgi:hypothetical protein